MGVKTQTVGGGAAVPLADDFINFLRAGLQSGQFGPGGQTTGPAALARTNLGSVIDSLLYPGENNAIQQMADRQRRNDVAELRARYTSGAAGYGSGAQVAEGNYLAELNPRVAQAVTAQQSEMLGRLLGMYGQFAQIGTPQAQTIQTPTLGANIMSGLTGLAGAGATFFAPGGVFGKNPFANAARPAAQAVSTAASFMPPVTLPPAGYGGQNFRNPNQIFIPGTGFIDLSAINNVSNALGGW